MSRFKREIKRGCGGRRRWKWAGEGLGEAHTPVETGTPHNVGSAVCVVVGGTLCNSEGYRGLYSNHCEWYSHMKGSINPLIMILHTHALMGSLTENANW